MTEESLRAVCATVLAMTDLSLDDNFVDLGGDSLTAIELANELSTLSGRNVQIGDIFAAGTLRDLL